MTQVGEAVKPPEFVNDAHSESTCPWHHEGNQKSKRMELPQPDEDTEAMPPNDGGKLGRSLQAPRLADSLSINYAPLEELRYQEGKKSKVVQAYAETDGVEVEYELQYAPHHLIPGNESLKGSEVVPFMGDADAIAEYANGQESHIKKGMSIGYDVNAATNGVWLPSPYALSNRNAWPAIPGIKIIKKRRGIDLAQEVEDFKSAYVAASIDVSGGRQFHMRHKEYSDKVREILKTIPQRLAEMAVFECPLTTGSEDDKFEPPMCLVGRLNVLSENLKRFLTGELWRPPLYTDAMTEQYAKDLKAVEQKGKVEKVF